MDLLEKEVIVEVPHRISGFFEIVDETNGLKINDPEKIGSRGAGFNLSAVGKTRIKVKDLDELNKSEVHIYINNEIVNQKAETTYYIYNNIRSLLENSVRIDIFHNFDLPVGCGYGASGSGALGTIFGLNYLFNLNLSNIEKGRIAHIAEVVNRTGLGTICGLLRGGLCILQQPGYPCVSEQIEVPNNYRIICASFGMIHTKTILTDPILNLRIKKAGRKALGKLIQKKDIKTFIKASIKFVEETEILEILKLYEIKKLINTLNKLNILGASMNQLGKAVYAICKKESVSEVLEILESYKPEVKVYNLSINRNGPHILKTKEV